MKAILEIIPVSRILVISYNLKLPVGIQEKYKADCVVDKTENCVRKLEYLHIGEGCEVSVILNRGQKEDEEVHREVNADEDVYHNHLVTEFMLHNVQHKQEEDTEDGFSQKISRCHEV